MNVVEPMLVVKQAGPAKCLVRAEPTYAIEMDAIDRDVRQTIARFHERRADQVGHVSRHRYTAANEPVIAGTRVPTEAIFKPPRPASSASLLRNAMTCARASTIDWQISVPSSTTD